MKAIINSHVYDTDTATLVGVYNFNEYDTQFTMSLYYTDNGSFFWVNQNDEIVPFAAESASAFIGVNSPEKWADIFGEPEEA